MNKEEQTEWDYRFCERLGCLCADATPTPEQIAIAKSEADEWVRQDYVSWLGKNAVLFDDLQKP